MHTKCTPACGRAPRHQHARMRACTHAPCNAGMHAPTTPAHAGALHSAVLHAAHLQVWRHLLQHRRQLGRLRQIAPQALHADAPKLRHGGAARPPLRAHRCARLPDSIDGPAWAICSRHGCRCPQICVARLSLSAAYTASCFVPRPLSGHGRRTIHGAKAVGALRRAGRRHSARPQRVPRHFDHCIIRGDCYHGGPSSVQAPCAARLSTFCCVLVYWLTSTKSGSCDVHIYHIELAVQPARSVTVQTEGQLGTSHFKVCPQGVLQQ